jgi:hypothetical protein
LPGSSSAFKYPPAEGSWSPNARWPRKAAADLPRPFIEQAVVNQRFRQAPRHFTRADYKEIIALPLATPALALGI